MMLAITQDVVVTTLILCHLQSMQSLLVDVTHRSAEQTVTCVSSGRASLPLPIWTHSITIRLLRHVELVNTELHLIAGAGVAFDLSHSSFIDEHLASFHHWVGLCPVKGKNFLLRVRVNAQDTMLVRVLQHPVSAASLHECLLGGLVGENFLFQGLDLCSSVRRLVQVPVLLVEFMDVGTYMRFGSILLHTILMFFIHLLIDHCLEPSVD